MHSANRFIISFIVAVAENGVIGNAGKLPWRLKSDLRRFRKLTMGHPLIMGRKTFQSIGKPLDGRDSIVITRDAARLGTNGKGGLYVAPSWVDAKILAQDLASKRQVQEIFIIGGASIFDLALADCARIYLTRVHASPAGDIYWTPPASEDWTVISSVYHGASDADEHPFTDIVMARGSSIAA